MKLGKEWMAKLTVAMIGDFLFLSFDLAARRPDVVDSQAIRPTSRSRTVACDRAIDGANVRSLL